MLGRFVPVFTVEQEKELADHVIKLDSHFYGLTLKDFRKLAFEFAELNQIKNPFDKNLQLAGKEWAWSFLKKNKLTLRAPTKTSLARVMGFNKSQVDTFFCNLEEVMVKHRFPPSRIFNMDESGINTVPNRAPKVVSVRGKKSVGKISSAERGQLTTIICAMSASGNYIPPAMIFARKRLKPELLNGAPPETVMFCSESGYSNSELFIEWIKHFQKFAMSTKDNPVLLVLDNHGSHIGINAVNFCRQHDICLLTIPPHSSHKLQPLDKCFFKPLKDFLSQMCDKWMVNNPGRVITQFQMAEIFGEAYPKAATMGKGINGFKDCGIYPINKYIFDEEDFLPCTVTDQEFPGKTNMEEELLKEKDGQSKKPMEHTQTLNELDMLSSSEDETPKVPSLTGPDQSKKDPWVSPADIKPLPKRKTAQKRKSKKQKSEILTSSPFKAQLEATEKEKQESEEKKKARKPMPAKKLSFSSKTSQQSSGSCFTKPEDMPSTSKEKVICPACDEDYADPPDEDWIQCLKCKEWWHEKCSNYEGRGHYVCDYC
jgi:hypothetical protein